MVIILYYHEYYHVNSIIFIWCCYWAMNTVMTWTHLGRHGTRTSEAMWEGACNSPTPSPPGEPSPPVEPWTHDLQPRGEEWDSNNLTYMGRNMKPSHAGLSSSHAHYTALQLLGRKWDSNNQLMWEGAWNYPMRSWNCWWARHIMTCITCWRNGTREHPNQCGKELEILPRHHVLVVAIVVEPWTHDL